MSDALSESLSVISAINLNIISAICPLVIGSATDSIVSGIADCFSRAVM